jgi:hypothetical protein
MLFAFQHYSTRGRWPGSRDLRPVPRRNHIAAEWDARGPGPGCSTPKWDRMANPAVVMIGDSSGLTWTPLAAAGFLLWVAITSKPTVRAFCA